MALLLTAPTLLASRPTPATSEPDPNRTAPSLTVGPAATLASLTAPSPFHPITQLHLRISTVRLSRLLSRGVLPMPTLSELGWTDPRGLPQTVTDPLGRTTTFEHDPAGAESRRVLPDGTAILTRYWPSGDPGTVTEQPGHPGQGPAQYVQRREHDLAGRPVRSIAPDGGVTTFTYDPLGRLASRIDPDQHLHTWDTSPLGTTVVESLAGKTATTRVTDADGLLLSLTESGGASFTATYDPAGRLQQRTLPGGVTHTLHWTPAGHLSGIDL
ncbi:MAG: hypothetical protein MUF10_16905, partial [Thermoanaerobaculaceae bacterium]|nr:hypothetical protein [Thermoanaerobaculaceae bacterium]